MRKPLGGMCLLAVMALALPGCPKQEDHAPEPDSPPAGAAEESAAEAPEPSPFPMHSLDQTVFSALVVDQPSSMRGDGQRGLIRIGTPQVDQVLQWNPIEESLQDKAEHERSLIQRAADEEDAPASVSELDRSDEPGRGSLRWSAAVAETHFRFALVDCGAHHVLVTSMGPDEGAVEQVQRQSLESFACKTVD